MKQCHLVELIEPCELYHLDGHAAAVRAHTAEMENYILNLWHKKKEMGKKYEQRKNPMEIMRFIFPLVSSTSCTKEMRKRKKSFWDRVFFFLQRNRCQLKNLCIWMVGLYKRKKFNRLYWGFRMEITMWSHIYYRNEITPILIASQSQFNSFDRISNATP